MAPRAGLEPATSRLQGPQSFDWAWTISSPAWEKQGRVSGASEAVLDGVPQPLVSARSCLHAQPLRQASLRITVPRERGRFPWIHPMVQPRFPVEAAV